MAVSSVMTSYAVADKLGGSHFVRAESAVVVPVYAGLDPQSTICAVIAGATAVEVDRTEIDFTPQYGGCGSGERTG